MASTTVSSKFQVVIPKEIRETLGLRSGEKLQVIAKNGVITMVPERRLRDLRGFVKGIDEAGVREKKDRL